MINGYGFITAWMIDSPHQLHAVLGFMVNAFLLYWISVPAKFWVGPLLEGAETFGDFGLFWVVGIMWFLFFWAKRSCCLSPVTPHPISGSLDWDLAPVQTTRSELKSLSTSWNCVKVLMLWDITNAVARLGISTFLESVVPLRIENCHIWKRGFKWMSGQIWNLYYFEVLSSWFRSYFASFRLFNCTACFLFGQHLTF